MCVYHLFHCSTARLLYRPAGDCDPLYRSGHLRTLRWRPAGRRRTTSPGARGFVSSRIWGNSALRRLCVKTEHHILQGISSL